MIFMDPNEILEGIQKQSEASPDSFTQDDLEEGKIFTQSIRKIIRREFRKAGLVVLGVLLAVFCFGQWGLSPLVSTFYYDPGKIIPNESFPQDMQSTHGTNTMSLDISVYTELLCPLNWRDTVIVNDRGYGCYDITIAISPWFPLSYNYDHQPTTVTGRIERGKLRLYNPLSPVILGNHFYYEEIEGEFNPSGDTWVDNAQYGFSSLLNRIPPHDVRKYVVSLKNPISIAEADKLAEKYKWGQVFYAVTVADPKEWDLVRRQGFIGYQHSFNGIYQDVRLHDREKYPLLLRTLGMYHSVEEKTTHFISMLKYMADRKEFVAMMKEAEEDFQTFYDSGPDFQAAYDYVQEHGVNIHGIVIWADKDTITRINDDPAVKYVSELLRH